MSWPEGLPRNYDELAKQYGDHIATQVARHNKVAWNLEDLLQTIWLKLIESRVLEKFVARASRDLPPTMLALEACEYLGITFAHWKKNVMYTAIKKAEEGDERYSWMPKPIDGSAYSKKALFLTDDILVLDECGYIQEESRTKQRLCPIVTSRGFKSYLNRAIHNHFANFCRSRKRKYSKEHMLDPTMVLSPTTDGYRRLGFSKSEDPNTAWEAALVSAMMIGADDAVDVADQLRRSGLALQPEPDRARNLRPGDMLVCDGEITALTSVESTKTKVAWEAGETKGSLRASAAVQVLRREGIETLDFMISQGYTVKEAIKAQHRVAARHRAKLRQRG
jgi:DNA-directed RNA polymerase specialized sigma24 family protein